jgi:hypothetical protein
MELIKPIDKIPDEDIKEIIKETKSNKRDYYYYYRKLMREFNLICFQVTIILLLLLLYINLYNSNVYDFIIYFCFGLAIAVMFIATFMLIIKYNIISGKISRKIRFSSMLSFSNKFLYLSEENTVKYSTFIFIIAHVIISIMAFIYVKKYIKGAKKTNNALLKSLILFCLWVIYNIYVIDVVKVYNKVLKTTKTETVLLIISTTITYSGLLYYFETIKNEKV